MDEKIQQTVSMLEELYSEGAPSPTQRDNPNQPSVIKLTRTKLGISESTLRRRLVQAEEEGYVLP